MNRLARYQGRHNIILTTIFSTVPSKLLASVFDGRLSDADKKKNPAGLVEHNLICFRRAEMNFCSLASGFVPHS
jgi:hypothetical protein